MEYMENTIVFPWIKYDKILEYFMDFMDKILEYFMDLVLSSPFSDLPLPSCE